MIRMTRRELILTAAAWAAVQRFSLAQSPPGARSGAVAGKLPKPSDVIFSTRSWHDNSVDTLKRFGANRCEWVYTEDQKVVEKLKAAVPFVGLSISSTQGTPNAAGAAVGVNGQQLVAPWMKTMGFKWNSSIRAATRDALTGQALKLVGLGADSIQFDDPNIEYGAYVFAGGDFSDEAVQGFARFAPADPGLSGESRASLERNNWNIKNWVQSAQSDPDNNWAAFKRARGNDPVWLSWGRYLRTTVASYVGSLREALHSAGHAVPLSANVPNPLPLLDRMFLMENTDYLISEINSDHGPQQLASYCMTSAAMGNPFVASLAPRQTGSTRWQIALAYALGANALVPWDVYVPPDLLGRQAPRYFGKVEDYGDLYQFIRSNPALFDGWNLVTQLAIMVSPGAATDDQITRIASSCRSLGTGFKFLVVGDRVTYGMDQFKTPPAAVVPVGVPADTVKRAFPSAQIVSPEELSRGGFNGSADIFRIEAPQGFVAFARENGGPNLLLHIIDVSGGSRQGPQYVDIQLPAGSRFASLKTATTLRPHLTPASMPIANSGRGGAGRKLRIVAPPATDWAVIQLSE